MNIHKLPIENEIIETVVFANGNFPEHPIPLNILNHCKRIIACDGAANILVKKGYSISAIVGDCDSLDPVVAEKYASILCRDKNQDTNDLTKTINYCITKGYNKIAILGATGKRDDHSIANIGLLANFMNVEITLISDSGSFVAIEKHSLFESYKGQQVSIFCLDYTPISAKNLLYSINNMVFNRWWQATLNESTSEIFEIIPSGATIIYREFTET